MQKQMPIKNQNQKQTQKQKPKNDNKQKSEIKTSTVAPGNARLVKPPTQNKIGVKMTKQKDVLNARLQKQDEHGTVKLPAVKAPMSDQITKRLKSKSAWLAAIEDPLHAAGVKTPDANGTATSTMQVRIPVPVAVSANGMTGVRVVRPFPNIANVSPAAVAHNFQILDPTSTPSALIWSNGVSPSVAGIQFPQMSVLASNSNGVRVVSMSVVAVPEQSSLSDSGEALGFVYPYGIPESRYASPMSYASYATLYDSSQIPLNKHKAQKALWYPTQFSVGYNDQDEVSYDYTDFVTTSEVYNTPPWTVGCVTTGSPASTGVVQYIIVVNYEFIPALNTVDLVNPAASPSDEFEENFVLTQLQQIPITKATSAEREMSAPTPTTQTSTPFGMMLDFVQLASGVAKLLL